MIRILPIALATLLLGCGEVSNPEVIAWFEVHVGDQKEVTLSLHGEVDADDGKPVELEVRLFFGDAETPEQTWATPFDDLGSDVQVLGDVFSYRVSHCGRYRAVAIVRDDAGGQGTSDFYEFHVSCDQFPEECLPDADAAYAPTADAATAIEGSCSAPELDALATEMSRADGSYLAMRASVTGTCASCIFTDLPTSTSSVPEWAAILVVTEGPERGYGQFNRGWCAGNSAQSPRCGVLSHAFAQCEAQVCDHCTTSESQHDECARWASGACGNVREGTRAECSADGAPPAFECSEMTPIEQIRTLCGP